MAPALQPQHADIQLVETADETTLYVDGGQAMQAWEAELMRDSADLLCGYGTSFLEAGLGLGLSALHIARKPSTAQHQVVEKYLEVIELFEERHQPLPSSLKIIHGDIFDVVPQLDSESLDGIFFDPFLPDAVNNDVSLWQWFVPELVRCLRIGGVLIPCFTSKPSLRWQFEPYFDRVVIERRRFEAYASTNYMANHQGSVFIQCFERCSMD
jgi:predicted methyltransferase